ncbi:hypothetical protein D0907_11695 [Pseudoalteromonas lipolytica]|uniref:Lipoprotein n=1 Tax=Pseudoalteromonas lipolytica TaxID=570156 RepID=A0AAD0S0S5_9GAMM|nr:MULTISPECIES: hypothetical protein [Pseudoalteromonas]AXV65882.1 hypothetical protein D0907_11695 [Pseudoalteromonas donghaensis]MBE0350247.1 hypothetical protein [Pseudoalteromonas lipolytica LMEB 39]SFT68945.1 hypothetical protein SAMN04487854_10774 [Pseudoalteromonas lipolytica]
MKFLITLLITLILSGCSSTNQHNDIDNHVGLTIKPLAENQYVLRYKSNRLSKQGVLDASLHHAAKLTLKQGYDWFVVTTQDTHISHNNTALNSHRQTATYTTRCGLLTCSRQASPYPSESPPHIAKREITTQLIIVLGKGIKPSIDAIDAYSHIHHPE